MNRTGFAAWLDGYFDAWRRNEAAAVQRLFAEDAVYHYGPYVEPARGRAQIVAKWVADSAPVEVEYRYEVVAVEGEVGVAHWWVRQRQAQGGELAEMDGILVIRFDAAGRCIEHREWYLRR